uniref:MAK10-like protein n=1 Tax=Tanacetum cinerariifolium TaxID=118510 RepID=A0A6L2LAI9_TANCI|nr:MAK10-like protein [Tanacetum cinerariifolium]
MECYKLKYLKLKEFDKIQEMFDRAFKRVNTFEDIITELVKGKEKRVGKELTQESTKKQKVEDDKEKETTKLKQLMEIIPDKEEVAIDAIPFTVKSPRIVEWKIHKEEKKSYYQIVRADRKSQMYMFFSKMLGSFNREDLEDLYKLGVVKLIVDVPYDDRIKFLAPPHGEWLGDENPIHTLRDYSKPSHEGYRNTIEFPVGKNVVPLRSDTIRRTIDQSADGMLHDQNAKEFWALLEDLALYDNESWNDPRDFIKPVKAISLPQDVPSTSDCRLIKFKNQVQCLMEAHLALTQPTQVDKTTTSCEICNGPYDTQSCMEDPKQAFVEYAYSRTDDAGGKWYTFKLEQNNIGDTYNPS